MIDSCFKKREYNTEKSHNLSQHFSKFLIPSQYFTLFCNVSQLPMSNPCLLFLSFSCTPYLSASFSLPSPSPLLLLLPPSSLQVFQNSTLSHTDSIFSQFSFGLTHLLSSLKSIKVNTDIFNTESRSQTFVVHKLKANRLI